MHDLARYKMGWIRINQANHAEAVTFFEAAAACAPLARRRRRPRRSRSSARPCSTWSTATPRSRPAKGAIEYFEKLSDSRATYSLALDKLGNRYFIKQQYEFAIPALRKLLEIQPDPELEVERVGEAVRLASRRPRARCLPKPEDVASWCGPRCSVKTDPAQDEVSRKKVLAELEEMGRDLATSIHVQAQKKEDKALYLEAAAAYEKYLALFRPRQYATIMMQNRADALFAARTYPEAARQFEELAQYLDSAKKGGPATTKPRRPSRRTRRAPPPPSWRRPPGPSAAR